MIDGLAAYKNHSKEYSDNFDKIKKSVKPKQVCVHLCVHSFSATNNGGMIDKCEHCGKTYKDIYEYKTLS